jgi:F0F1-type ATP synthase assembly protein I
MGAFEAVDDAISGLIGAVIVGAMIAALWATINLYFGNSDVFALGLIVIAIIGFIPLIYVVGMLKKLMRSTQTEDTRREI